MSRSAYYKGDRVYVLRVRTFSDIIQHYIQAAHVSRAVPHGAPVPTEFGVFPWDDVWTTHGPAVRRATELNKAAIAETKRRILARQRKT